MKVWFRWFWFHITLCFFAELRELRRRSQAVQRKMPRPSDANAAVLRPANVDPPLTGLQQVKTNEQTNKQTNKQTAVKKIKPKHRQTPGIHRHSKTRGKNDLLWCIDKLNEMCCFACINLRVKVRCLKIDQFRFAQCLYLKIHVPYIRHFLLSRFIVTGSFFRLFVRSFWDGIRVASNLASTCCFRQSKSPCELRF